MKALTSAISAFRSGEGLKGQLLRGGVGSVAIKIGSTLLNVLLAIVLARALGAEGFGVYSFVFALITILAIPAQMGLPNLVVRETAKAQAAGDWALINGLWRWSSVMALSMSAALMAIGGLAAWIFAANLPEGGLGVFFWGLVLVPLVALGNLRGAALRGLRHVVWGQLPEYILRPTFLILLVLAVHFGLSARALTASDTMMLHAVASLVAFVIGAYLLMRARPTPLREAHTSNARRQLWLASALPLGLVEGMHVINENLGALILGAMASAEDVGLYRIAMHGTMLIAFGLTAANIVIAPHFAKLHFLKDYASMQKLVTTSSRCVAIFAVSAFLFLLVFGRDILQLAFGEEFSDAYLALIILGSGQLANAYTGSVGPLLNMAGYERQVVNSMVVGTLVNISCTLALVPTFGVVGAAVGSSFALFVWNVMMLVQAKRHLNVRTAAWGL